MGSAFSGDYHQPQKKDSKIQQQGFSKEMAEPDHFMVEPNHPAPCLHKGLNLFFVGIHSNVRAQSPGLQDTKEKPLK